MDDIYSPKLDIPEEGFYQGDKRKSDSKNFLSKVGSHLIDFIQTLVVFGAIFATIYLFIAQPHKVSGNSMVPTFHHGDYILTDKLSYRFGQPKRSDVIVLKNPSDPSQDFIKRIIAIPGDNLIIDNNQTFINGSFVNEDYLPNNVFTSDGSFISEGKTIKADPGQYFVMGDNRAHSSDSREWGPITKEHIIGKVFFRYWPIPSFGLL